MKKNNLLKTSIGLLLISFMQTAWPVNLMVLEARGAGLKSGMQIDSEHILTLKEGERITVIAPDGRSTKIKGPFSGMPLPKNTIAQDPKQALAALVTTRDARTSSIGVIRAGTHTIKIPEPWLIDVTRPGPRCLLEGELPVWWRPENTAAERFTVFPIDRSWRADFSWDIAQDRQAVPRLSRFEGAHVFIIRQNETEYAIAIHVIPKIIDNSIVLASWMLEKGCIQQADRLLADLTQTQDITPE